MWNSPIGFAETEKQMNKQAAHFIKRSRLKFLLIGELHRTFVPIYPTLAWAVEWEMSLSIVQE